MTGFDPSLLRGTLLPDILGIPIEVSPYLPKDTAYLFPAAGPNQARFISDAHFDWRWQIFLWNQKDLARRHLAQLVREAEERLGLLPEPPPERISPRALSSFPGHILQGEVAAITVPRPSLLDWSLRWMPPINLSGPACSHDRQHPGRATAPQLGLGRSGLSVCRRRRTVRLRQLQSHLQIGPTEDAGLARCPQRGPRKGGLMPEIDYDALPGYEVDLLRPECHEGVRYQKATLLYFRHDPSLWVACLRPRREVEAHSMRVQDPLTRIWTTTIVPQAEEQELRVSFPTYYFDEDRWRQHFKALPMRPTQMEAFASAFNTALADSARVERRAEPKGGG